MHRGRLLIVTAIIETGTGIGLLVVPRFVLALLLGISPAAAETVFVGRVAGAALLAIGVASWLSRGEKQSGLLTGILAYDVVAAGLLAFAGSVLGMNGVLLWLAVAVHAALAVWCVACLKV
jgi:hypothetical protein